MIKWLFTFRERLPLGQWLRQMVEMVRSWSSDLDSRKTICATHTQPWQTCPRLTSGS